MKLYEAQGCLCEWQEIPNNVASSTVKGYTKVGVPCAKCQNDAIIAEAHRLAQEDDRLVNDLIEGKKREMAIKELKLEGKLDNDGKLIK